jgi:hypothetical protein
MGKIGDKLFDLGVDHSSTTLVEKYTCTSTPGITLKDKLS